MGIEELISSNKRESWSLKHERIFKENIEKQANELSRIGLLRTLNYEAVAHQVDNIK